MNYLYRAALVALPFLAACSGGSSSGSLPQPPSGPVASSAGIARTTVEPLESVRQRVFVSGSADLLYVANVGSESITVYHHDAQGDSAPLYVIAGSRTGIDHPGQLAQDAQGNLYVANGSLDNPSAKPGILVFAHGANGNVAPLRVLAGPATGIHNVAAMTVDQSTGKIFVDDLTPGSGGNLVDVALLRFPPAAAGNTAPFARSGGELFPALEFAQDSSGLNLIEAHQTNEPDDFGLGVDTFFKQFANGASPLSSPSYAISAFGATGIADDPTTKTYLTTTNAGIYRFAETTNGSGGVEGDPATFHPAVVSIITSDTCGTQMALGYLRNVYVTHAKPLCSSDAIDVYEHDASGNVAPLRVLSGAATGLNRPDGIYEGQ